MTLSADREQKVINDIVNNGVYVSLHVGDEGNSPDGSQEVTASDYSRQFIQQSDISVSGSGPTTIENSVVVEWTQSANTDWGVISHAALWSDVQGATGVVPYTSTISLNVNQDVKSGDIVDAAAGNIQFNLD